MQLLPVGTELHMCSAVGRRMPDLGAWGYVHSSRDRNSDGEVENIMQQEVHQIKAVQADSYKHNQLENASPRAE